jgi:hypothetical protein
MKLEDSAIGDSVVIQKAIYKMLKAYMDQESKLRNKELKDVILNFHTNMMDIPGLVNFLSSVTELENGSVQRLRSVYSNLVMEITVKEVKRLERSLFYAISRSGNYNFIQRLILRRNIRMEPLAIFMPVFSKLQMELANSLVNTVKVPAKTT